MSRSFRKRVWRIPEIEIRKHFFLSRCQERMSVALIHKWDLLQSSTVQLPRERLI